MVGLCQGKNSPALLVSYRLVTREHLGHWKCTSAVRLCFVVVRQPARLADFWSMHHIIGDLSDDLVIIHDIFLSPPHTHIYSVTKVCSFYSHPGIIFALLSPYAVVLIQCANASPEI